MIIHYYNLIEILFATVSSLLHGMIFSGNENEINGYITGKAQSYFMKYVAVFADPIYLAIAFTHVPKLS